MTPERWQSVKDVFFGALEQEVDNRVAFLSGACAGDTELLRQVEALLADHDNASSFIESPALATGVSWTGRRLGAYRVLEEIDHGGMGTVYLGERADEQYSRKVAIKLIRADVNSELMAGRFRQERQILADLDHPGIARLLDGGTTEGGQPYLVMEYIEGEPIDVYCERRALSVDKRLELFRKVCAAVHYAHQNLVIHRDIKPSNVLVTAEGEPKLLDFGTAKLLGPALADSGAAPTQTGLRLMTPEYASPEQLRAEAITTASDVYALGVVLYELLTGRRPYCFESRHSPEVLRIVCEHEPEKPSSVVGARRAALRRRLAGDLDNIVMMALRKEPGRRYGSVEQLSQDVHRHLTGRPVAARKDTWTYHLGKFVKRHRIAVAVGLLAAATIVAVAGVALWQARRAHHERARAEQVAAFLVDIFEVSKPSESRGADPTAREVLERGEAKLRHELGDQPEVRAALMDTIGVVYHKIGALERAEALLDEALELRLRVVGQRHLDTAASWLHLGQLALDRGLYDSAESFLQRSFDLRVELLGQQDPRVAENLDELGRLHYARGDFTGAEALHRRALEMNRKLHGGESREVAEGLNNVAAALWGAGRVEESEPLLREALAIRRRLFGSLHPDLTNSLNNLAGLLYTREDYAAAEPLLREALAIDLKLNGEEHPYVAADLDFLATVCLKQGRLDEAEDLYRRALAMRRQLLGQAHPDVAFSLNNLAVLVQERRAYDEAEDLYRQALSMRREVLGDEHPDVAFSYANLARLLRRMERYEEAADLYRQALAIQGRNLPPRHPTLTALEGELDECLQALERPAPVPVTLPAREP